MTTIRLLHWRREETGARWWKTGPWRRKGEVRGQRRRKQSADDNSLSAVSIPCPLQRRRRRASWERNERGGMHCTQPSTGLYSTLLYSSHLLPIELTIVVKLRRQVLVRQKKERRKEHLSFFINSLRQHFSRLLTVDCWLLLLMLPPSPSPPPLLWFYKSFFSSSFCFCFVFRTKAQILVSRDDSSGGIRQFDEAARTCQQIIGFSFFKETFDRLLLPPSSSLCQMHQIWHTFADTEREEEEMTNLLQSQTLSDSCGGSVASYSASNSQQQQEEAP